MGNGKQDGILFVGEMQVEGGTNNYWPGYDSSEVFVFPMDIRKL